MSHKQATMKELRAEAERTGKPQVRMSTVVVWSDGGSIQSDSGPPLTAFDAVSTLMKVWGPLLAKHHGYEIILRSVKSKKVTP